MDNDALSLLMRHLDEDRAELTRAIAEGTVEDFAAFQGLRGQILGLSRARLRVEELRDRLRREDN
jgi:hypothetical protein